MPLFQEKATELVTLSKAIDKLDAELDEVVFELYGFTEDEKAIIG